MLDDRFVIEPNAHPRTHHDDAEGIPLTERLVSQHQRILTGSARRVIPKTARPLVSPDAELGFFGVIPNLHLRNASQVNPRISQRNRLVLQEQFEIAVILLSRGIGAIATIH